VTSLDQFSKILSLLVDMPYTSFCRHSVVTLALETSSFQRGRIPILSAENSKSVSTLKSQSASQKSCYRALCGNKVVDLMTDFDNSKVLSA